MAMMAILEISGRKFNKVLARQLGMKASIAWNSSKSKIVINIDPNPWPPDLSPVQGAQYLDQAGRQKFPRNTSHAWWNFRRIHRWTAFRTSCCNVSSPRCLPSLETATEAIHRVFQLEHDLLDALVDFKISCFQEGIIKHYNFKSLKRF